jgi:hypothetical protein
VKNWFSPLTIRQGKYTKGNDLPQHQPRARKDEGGWSSILSNGPRWIIQRSNNKLKSQNDLRRRQLQQVTEKMRQWPKRPRDLPWPPKSVPAEIRNDERQAGHLLCPLVTVDFVIE